mgnify:CR=1 FL=1
MKTYKYIYTACAGILCCLLVSACSAADNGLMEPAETDGTVKVPINISIGSVWFVDQSDTKAAPPEHDTSWEVDGSEEIEGTDKVKIFVFRRKDMDDIEEGENRAPFIYDPSNEQIVDCAKNSPEAHRLTAQGTLKKVYGYEYRVVAVAYNSTKVLPNSGGKFTGTGEDKLFKLDATDITTYDEFMLDIETGGVWKDFLNGGASYDQDTGGLSKQLAYGPQLFYGFCHLATDKNPIIKYSVADADDGQVNNLPLTGVLYRAMAKVEVRLKSLRHAVNGYTERDMLWASLLADNVYTQSRMSDYDDFLNPQAPVGSGYTLIDYRDGFTTGDSIVLTAYLLPTKTHLALRCKFNATVEFRMHNGQICVKDASFADNATGVISPDAQESLFYFRRNHKYVLRGNTETILKDHAF